MKIKKQSLLIILFLTAWISGSYAQTASVCANTLRTARTTYDEGKMHELPAIMKSCLVSGFTDEEKTEAYRLLVLSYIYLDEPENADQAMLDLLNVSKEFKPNDETDPSEFINLYKTFRTKALFRYGAAGGGNTTLVNVVKKYSVIDNTDGAYGSPTQHLSFQAGLVFEKDFFPKISLKAAALYVSKKTEHTSSGLLSFENGVNNAELVRPESQAWIALDVLGQYRLSKKDPLDRTSWNTYVTLGPSIQYLIVNTRTSVVTNTGGAGEKGADEDLLISKTNRPLDLGVKVGAGVKRKIGLNYITFELTYVHGLFNITDKNFDSGASSFRYGEGSNDINLHQIQFSIGFIAQWFSPKKLEN